MALGVAFNLCPNISVDDGINACRGYFSRCCFDESKCDVGLRRLETYRKDWDDERGVWKSRPRHDAASHGADAFRYSVVSSGVRARGLSGGGSGELWAE